MKKLIVLDVVGITNKILKNVNLPNIVKIFEDGFCASMIPPFPAVTCTVQASLTSGHYPERHGIICNGHYDRNHKQVSFWEQYNSSVEMPRIWDILKKTNPNLKTAVLFWQNSLYINSDIVITPKPIHLENKMIMWCYSKPVNYYEELVEHLGEFDLKWYWGPFVSIKSTKWIIEATKYTINKHKPDLVLVYLPHLDYAAQKFGPSSNEFKQSLFELDNIIGDLIEFLNSSVQNEYEIIIHAEYGFFDVKNSISPNIILRDNGMLATRIIDGKEYVDFENSKAFAMVDHQVSHVYLKNGYEDKIKMIFESNENIVNILDKKSQKSFRINHSKSGELILCAEKDSWFNYYWWVDEKFAPPFSFSVDIHRKPGYDPLELFLDKKTKTISQDTSLVKGSHGICDQKDQDELPIFAMSMNPSQKIEKLDVIQIAPTISNFFGVKGHFEKKSIL